MISKTDQIVEKSAYTISFSLSVKNLQVEPSEITRLLEVTPTRAIRKGEIFISNPSNGKIFSRVPSKRNVWFYKSPSVSGSASDGEVDRIWDEFWAQICTDDGAYDEINKFDQKLVLTIYISATEFVPGVFLDASKLGFLASKNISLDLDVSFDSFVDS